VGTAALGCPVERKLDQIYDWPIRGTIPSKAAPRFAVLREGSIKNSGLGRLDFGLSFLGGSFLGGAALSALRRGLPVRAGFSR
jgi:hypothetical protein